MGSHGVTAAAFFWTCAASFSLDFLDLYSATSLALDSLSTTLAISPAIGVPEDHTGCFFLSMKEVVFFAEDVATEEIRGREGEKAFARSMSVEDAMRPENMLAFEMNGEPLPHYHGKPVRLVVPGWYGVANVKWINQIHVQDTRYMGRFMGRDYVTLKRSNVGGVERWVENSVTTMNLKSAIVRVIEDSAQHRIQGFVLNDGTPIESVEIKIDDGPVRAIENACVVASIRIDASIGCCSLLVQ